MLVPRLFKCYWLVSVRLAQSRHNTFTFYRQSDLQRKLPTYQVHPSAVEIVQLYHLSSLSAAKMCKRMSVTGMVIPCVSNVDCWLPKQLDGGAPSVTGGTRANAWVFSPNRFSILKLFQTAWRWGALCWWWCRVSTRGTFLFTRLSIPLSTC